jgi:hypothetical protein
VHVHHVHRKAVQVIRRLEDAAPADAVVFAGAQPAGGDTRFAGGFERFVRGAAGAVALVERLLQVSVECLAGEFGRELGDELSQVVGCGCAVHEERDRACGTGL